MEDNWFEIIMVYTGIFVWTMVVFYLSITIMFYLIKKILK